MKTAHRLEFFTDGDGEPWACFAWGEVPPETITRERIEAAAEYYAGISPDDLCLDAFTVSTFWIRSEGPSEEFEERWCRCAEIDDNAIQVTGVQFQ